MTDKVQKIREEVERIQLYTQSEVLKQVLDYIDEVKKEPVSKPIDFEQELYKYFGQVKDFTLGMKIAQRFYEIGKQHQEQMMKGAFIPGFKSIEFKLGEEYTFNSKNFDMEKAKAYGAKEGDTIIGYFIKKED